MPAAPWHVDLSGVRLVASHIGQEPMHPTSSLQPSRPAPAPALPLPGPSDEIVHHTFFRQGLT